MKDSREQPKLIDTINLNPKGIMSPIYIGRSDIYVYSNEGTIPHFHIIPKNGKSEICICIFEPFYFNHNSSQLELNYNQRKILEKWINKKSKLLPEVNNWRLISIFWKVGNYDEYIIGSKCQPNYTYIKRKDVK